MELIVPKARANFYVNKKFEKQTSYFHFSIYFTKNMNQLVYNEEIKSHDLHTINNAIKLLILYLNAILAVVSD
jgi:hypothetical protein